MTYLEKLMTAIKFDDEMLTAEEIETMRKCCYAGICVCVRPARFPSLCCDDKSDWDEEIFQ